MPGTRAGGLKAAATNREKYGANFYAEIGRKGGENGHSGGFSSSHKLAVEAGRKGGAISSRSETKAPLWKRRKAYRENTLREKTQQPPLVWLKQFKEKRKRAERSK